MQENRVTPFIDPSADGAVDLAQSLRPILVLMRIIGIELDQRKMAAPRRFFIFCFGSLMLLFHVVASLPALMNILKYCRAGDGLKAVTMATWNTDVNYFQSTWTNIGIHCTMIVVALSRWKPLWNCFDRMQQSTSLARVLRGQMARVAIMGVIIIITEMVYDCLSLSLRQWEDVSTFSWLLGAASNGSHLYPTSAIALFVCLGWVTSIMLDALVKDIQSYPIQGSVASHASNHLSVGLLALEWKQMHVLVCEFLQHINCCFGLVLLMFISKQFVCIINDAFMTTITLQTTNRVSVVNVLSVLATMKNLFYLYMVTYVSEKIRNQVVTISQELRKVEISDPLVQHQVDFFMLEVLHISPKITAMGFFEVDLRLYRALIGTTVTYLIILCQFQTSGKNLP